jgi:hypothetical protein
VLICPRSQEYSGRVVTKSALLSIAIEKSSSDFLTIGGLIRISFEAYGAGDSPRQKQS